MSSLQPMMVDSNIPMYAAGREHTYREPCQIVLRRIISGAIAVMTSTEVHQEILHRYVAIDLAGKAREVSEDFQDVVRDIVPVTMDDIDLARRLTAMYPGLRARDLVHLAVMFRFGLTEIISTDRHFDHVAEIRRVDPLHLASG